MPSREARPTRTARQPMARRVPTVVRTRRTNRRAATSNIAALLLLSVLSSSAATLSSSDAAAEAFEPKAATCEQEIAAAARRYEIPLAVFYAIGLNESGVNGRLQPYSMNIDGAASENASLAEALARFRQAKSHGAKMIDIGCMQINHHFHAAHFESLEAMFDPAKNIDYAARFLHELKARERTWTMAVARYNAGPNNDPAQKQYVCGVLTRMVASGFGEWTESARHFCFAPTVARTLQ